jgi:hypothetical protein
MTVELLSPAEAVPSNERWYEARRGGITASEIAVVLGISPYGSPFSLYWQKVNDWRWEGNAFTSVGRHLEDAIADWWEREHTDPADPALYLRAAGLYAHSDRPWQLATPDRLIMRAVEGRRASPTSPTCWSASGWRTRGTAGASPAATTSPSTTGRSASGRLDVLGVDEVHVAALGPGGFRAYVVRRDDDDLRRDAGSAGEAFHKRLVSR